MLNNCVKTKETIIMKHFAAFFLKAKNCYNKNKKTSNNNKNYTTTKSTKQINHFNRQPANLSNGR